jgi:hypothetical protein
LDFSQSQLTYAPLAQFVADEPLGFTRDAFSASSATIAASTAGIRWFTLHLLKSQKLTLRKTAILLTRSTNERNENTAFDNPDLFNAANPECDFSGQLWPSKSMASWTSRVG